MGQWLGYLAAVTLTLALAWTVRNQWSSAIPAGGATGRLSSLMMQLAYSLSSNSLAHSMLLVPFEGTDSYPSAVAAAGLVALGARTQLRILAVGLPASAGASPSRPEYTAEAYLTDGTRWGLGPLTLVTAKRRWVLDAVLPYPATQIERIVILRRDKPLMQANLALTGRESGT